METFGEFSYTNSSHWVNSSGHFLMVITNSANTVDQLMQGVA